MVASEHDSKNSRKHNIKKHRCASFFEHPLRNDALYFLVIRQIEFSQECTVAPKVICIHVPK